MDHFHTSITAWIFLAVFTFLLLVVFKIKAPYGRHASKHWGPMIPNHLGWFWMELPALLVFPLPVIFGPAGKTPLTWLLLGLWLLHYVYRTLIFPFQLKTSGKKMPLVIVLSALFFNGVNGFLNGYFLGFLAQSESSFLQINTIAGVLLFFTGMFINRSADQRLIALRKEQSGYQIPKGWLFEYISCPNYFGEILEWIGFALVAWNLPATSFALWTFCNLVPRALNHHHWYQQQFADYPKGRKAVLPFLW